LVRGVSAVKLRQLAEGLRLDHARRINRKEAPAMGSLAAVVAATSTKGSSSSYTFLLLIVLVFVGFYFLMIRPQRRRQQQAQQKQRELSPGARVRTTAGMYATVTAVDGDDVILEVAPGIDVRYLRRAVMEVIASGEDEETEPLEDAEADDEAAYPGEYAEDGFPEDDEPSDVDGHAGTETEPGSVEEHDEADSAGDNHAKFGTGNAF
jgi:preprotein translocase subunit YajC